MKVILTKDIRDVGRAHSVIEVSDGHALNHLFPRKLAIAASAQNLKMAEGKQKQQAEKSGVEAALVTERIAALADGVITITKKANEQGHLYDGVDAAEIAAAAELPESSIKLEKPIKELGSFDVPVAVGDAFGSIKVEVVAE